MQACPPYTTDPAMQQPSDCSADQAALPSRVKHDRNASPVRISIAPVYRVKANDHQHAPTLRNAERGHRWAAKATRVHVTIEHDDPIVDEQKGNQARDGTALSVETRRAGVRWLDPWKGEVQALDACAFGFFTAPIAAAAPPRRLRRAALAPWSLPAPGSTA